MATGDDVILYSVKCCHDETLPKSLYSCIWKIKLWLTKLCITFKCTDNVWMANLKFIPTLLYIIIVMIVMYTCYTHSDYIH